MKNLLLEFKLNALVVWKDKVDVTMLSLAVVVSILALSGFDTMGAMGFFTFYIAFLLLRYGSFKRELYELKNKH